MQACESAGFKPRLAQEGADLQVIMAFVAAGLGVSVVSASIQNMRRPGVVYRELQDTTEELELAVAWRRDGKSALVDAFVNIAKEVAARDHVTV